MRYGHDGANHLDARIDASNPVFRLRPVEMHRLLALRARLRGGAGNLRADDPGPRLRFEGLARAAPNSCTPSASPAARACRPVRPRSLIEKSVLEMGMPERTVVTTCAYCGVGCSFKAELKGDQVVRMIPLKAGKANEGHSCVKGRFAYGYATHKDRVLKPMIRKRIEDPWREVSWDEALQHAASEFKRIQAAYGRDSVGAISSSRCTNEEVFVVQKLVRMGFGNNNVDTCARVCHSPTGFGLANTYGTSAGTQDFKSVDKSDVIIVIGANPTDAHPVFASRLKKRLRAGARLIVIDPRRIDLVRSPHIEADHHLALRPGTNVAVLTAMAHVVVTEGLVDEAFVARALRQGRFRILGALRRRGAPFARSDSRGDRHRSRSAARGGAALCDRRERRDLLWPRRHRARAGLDCGHGDCQSRHGDRQHRPRGRRGQSSPRPEQRAGFLRHGLVPARVFWLPPRLRRCDAGRCSSASGACRSARTRACASPT